MPIEGAVQPASAIGGSMSWQQGPGSTPPPSQPPPNQWQPNQPPPNQWPPNQPPPNQWQPNQPPPWGQAPSGGWIAPPPQPGPAPGVEFAGFGARFLAYVIDAIVVSFVIVVCFVVLAIVVGVGGGFGSGVGTRPSSSASAAVGIVFLIAFVLLLAYYPWFWSHGGQTPGMRAMGIRVVRDQDGGPVSGGQAIIRLIGYWLSGAILYLGFIWIFIDARRRGWHDLIAGTVVIVSR
jgi:uncharacterized RDD family membrane protein YckC